MDNEYNYYLNNIGYFYNGGSISYSFENNKPIATLSKGASAFFKFDGEGIDVCFQRYTRTGNVKVYIDGVLKETFVIGTSSNYQDTTLSINGLSSGSHTLQIVSEGNEVTDRSTGRSATSNVVVSYVRGVSSIDNDREFQNFTFLFTCLLLGSLLICSLFRLFGIFGGGK